MRFTHLTGGDKVPALGLGTWRMGETARARTTEIAAVKTALQIGYRLIDTAEMYGDGGAEEVVGAALQDDGAIQDRLARRVDDHFEGPTQQRQSRRCDARLRTHLETFETRRD